MFRWVGFASTPLSFIKRQSCHAVRPFLLLVSSMTTAFKSPRPRTSLTRGVLEVTDGVSEHVAKPESSLGEVLLNQNVESRNSQSASERVSNESISR